MIHPQAAQLSTCRSTVVVVPPFMLMMKQVSRHRSTDFSQLADLYPDQIATRQDLIGLGLDPSTASRRCLPGGGWTRLLPGVYLLTGGKPSRRQLVRAALLKTRPTAAITGVEAARLYGVRNLPEDDRVHVLVPHERCLRSRDFLLVERTHRPWGHQFVSGLPVATVARALVDATRRLWRLAPVRAMIADAVQRSLCAPDALGAELTYLRLGGTSIPRRVFGEIADGVRSVAEAWAYSLVKRSPLAPPSWNVRISSPAGKQLAVVDAWWDEVGLAWEIDSKEFHLSPDDYERTLTRHSALTATGVLVVHTVPSRLKTDPAGVISELVGAFHAAAARARPAVTATLHRPV